jgi:hypothetical protein
MEQVLRRLKDEYRTAGNAALFDWLKQLLPDEPGAPSRAEIAREFGMNENASNKPSTGCDNVTGNCCVWLFSTPSLCKAELHLGTPCGPCARVWATLPHEILLVFAASVNNAFRRMRRTFVYSCRGPHFC